MKKVLFTFVMLIFTAPIFAQSVDDIIEVERSLFNAEKKAIVAENMILSNDEADAFWPVYEDFQAALYKLQTERVKIIKDYAKNYEKIDDVKADELMGRSLKHKQAVLKLEMQYYKKFKKVLSPAKVARFYQINNKVNALVNAEIVLGLPLVESK